jgi:hypothetical protein
LVYTTHAADKMPMLVSANWTSKSSLFENERDKMVGKNIEATNGPSESLVQDSGILFKTCTIFYNSFYFYFW